MSLLENKVLKIIFGAEIEEITYYLHHFSPDNGGSRFL
jgi:hypothetical protein